MVFNPTQKNETNYSYEVSAKTEQNFLGIIRDHLILEIFSHLSIATLGLCCCVSKQWKYLANEPSLWKIAIYREIAFGNDKWAHCFGANVVKNEKSGEDFSFLPSDDFIADCRKFKKIFPEKNVKDSLMLVRLPKTLNGGLSLKNLDNLANHYFSHSDHPLTNNSIYRLMFADVAQELEDRSIDKSYWVLMTKDVLPTSRSKNYDEQQKIVADLAKKSLISYEVPEALESVACIFSQYFGSNMFLFSDKPWTFTRCKERIKGYQIGVGGLTEYGLCVCREYYDLPRIGVAALRKF